MFRPPARLLGNRVTCSSVYLTTPGSKLHKYYIILIEMITPGLAGLLAASSPSRPHLGKAGDVAPTALGASSGGRGG